VNIFRCETDKRMARCDAIAASTTHVPGLDTKHLWDAPFVLMMAIGVTIRFLALGQQSFWDDEMSSLVSASGFPDGSLLTTVLNIHGPLYLVLLRGWIALFGQSEAIVRMLSAILGSAGLVLFYWFGLRVVGRAATLVGLGLLAISPYYLWYSQEARNYALLFDVGLVAVLAFLLDVERKTRGTFIAALGATVAGCLANLSGLFLLAFQGVYWLAIRKRTGYPMVRLIVLFVLVLVALSPWIIRAAQATGQVHLGRDEHGAGVFAVKGESPPGLLSIPFTYYIFSFGLSAGPSVEELKLYRWPALMPHLWYLVPGSALFVLAALWGLRALRRSSRSFTLLLLWVTVPVLLMAAASSLNLKAPNPRYASLAFAPYLLLVGMGVFSIRIKALRTMLLAFLVLLSVYSDYGYFRNSRYWRPDARSAGKLLREQVKPGDGVIIYSLSYPVKYYVRDVVSLKEPQGKDFADEASMEHWLRAYARDKERIWVVQCHGWWIDREDRFLHLCQRIMVPAGEWHFPWLPVFLFEKPKDWASQEVPVERVAHFSSNRQPSLLARSLSPPTATTTKSASSGSRNRTLEMKTA
jgi:uncharacterized membrane protein